MRYLTKTEVADILHVSVRTVTEYLRLGRLPAASRLGRRLLWREDAIVRCVDETVPRAVVHRSVASRKPGRPRKF